MAFSKFSGVILDKSRVKSEKYVVVCMESADYIRGGLFLAGSTGYKLKILGTSNGLTASIGTDKKYESLYCERHITMKYTGSFDIYYNSTLATLEELIDNELTIAFIPAWQFVTLEGFDLTKYDFSGLFGVCNADILLHKVFLRVKKEEKNNEIKKVTFEIDKESNSFIYDNELIGTHRTYWNWTTSNSLASSSGASGSTTWINSGCTYSTDHYIFDGTNDNMSIANASGGKFQIHRGVIAFYLDITQTGADDIIYYGIGSSVGVTLTTSSSTTARAVAAGANYAQFTGVVSATRHIEVMFFIPYKRLAKFYNLTTNVVSEKYADMSTGSIDITTTGNFYLGSTSTPANYLNADIYKLGIST